MFVPPHLLIHLPYLAQVARFNSFTKAAEALHVTQAAVSYQVKQLETKTGNRLVTRQSGGKTQLTEAGRLLVAEFNHCDKRLRLALEHLDFESNAGVLRITTPVDFGSVVMPKVLLHLQGSAPHLKVHCHTSDVSIDLEQSDWDMAISFLPHDSREESSVVYRSALVIVASNAYLEQHGAATTAGELLNHQLLTRYGSSHRNWQAVFAGTSDIGNARHLVSVGNTFALLEGAKQGLGIAVLPKFCVAEALAGGLLRVVCPQLLLPEVRFCLRKIQAPQINHYEKLLRNALSELNAEP